MESEVGTPKPLPLEALTLETRVSLLEGKLKKIESSLAPIIELGNFAKGSMDSARGMVEAQRETTTLIKMQILMMLRMLSANGPKIDITKDWYELKDIADKLR